MAHKSDKDSKCHTSERHHRKKLYHNRVVVSPSYDATVKPPVHLLDKYPDCPLIKQYVACYPEYDRIGNYLSPTYKCTLCTLYFMQYTLRDLSDIMASDFIELNTNPTAIPYEYIEFMAQKSMKSMDYMGKLFSNYKRFTDFATSPEFIALILQIIPVREEMKVLYKNMRTVPKYKSLTIDLLKEISRCEPMFEWCSTTLETPPQYTAIDFADNCKKFIAQFDILSELVICTT